MSPVFLASDPDPQTLVTVLVAAAVMIGGMFAMVAVLATKYYRRCPSNRILVIFGKTSRGQSCQCVHGGAKFIIPLLQDYRWLRLDAIRVEITGPAATDELAESMFLPNVFNIAIGTEPELMQNAAIHLLDQTPDEIRQLAEDAILSRLDQVLAELRSRPSDDGSAVINSLNETVASDLHQVGLTLLNSRRV